MEPTESAAPDARLRVRRRRRRRRHGGGERGAIGAAPAGVAGRRRRTSPHGPRPRTAGRTRVDAALCLPVRPPPGLPRGARDLRREHSLLLARAARDRRRRRRRRPRRGVLPRLRPTATRSSPPAPSAGPSPCSPASSSATWWRSAAPAGGAAPAPAPPSPSPCCCCTAGCPPAGQPHRRRAGRHRPAAPLAAGRPARRGGHPRHRRRRAAAGRLRPHPVRGAPLAPRHLDARHRPPGRAGRRAPTSPSPAPCCGISAPRAAAACPPWPAPPWSDRAWSRVALLGIAPLICVVAVGQAACCCRCSPSR